MRNKAESRPFLTLCIGGRRRFLFPVLLALILSLLQVPAVYAQKAVIKDLVITNSKENLLVYFTLQDAFTKEMKEAARNGIPVTFTFSMKVNEVRKGWLNSELTSVSFDHILSYDSLKDEYYVQRGEQDGRKVAIDTLAAAMKKMCEVNGYRLLSVSRLQPDKDYTLKVRASLVKKELPFKLNYLIPFYSLWGFTTDWVTVAFRY